MRLSPAGFIHLLLSYAQQRRSLSMATAFLLRRPILLSRSATTCLARTSFTPSSSSSSSSRSRGRTNMSTSASTLMPIFSSPLVTVEEVKEAMVKSPDSIHCVDASWHLGGDRNGKREFREGHLPGAVFFDIDEIADLALPLPHMLPSEEVFSSKASDLGLSSNDTIIVYAKRGSFSAPRCWWTFRAFGHERVHVLNGGFPAWEASGGSVEQGDVKPASTRPSSGLVQMSGNAWKLRSKGFQGRLNAPMLRTWRQVLAQSEQGKDAAGQVVDARSLARFRAEAPEPRAGVAGGHVPGSTCLPFSKVLVEGDINSFSSPEEIRKAFEDAGVDVDSPFPITTTCGSGVTAAVLTFALELAGRKAELSPVYDGAWAEWGSRDDLPKSTGSGV
ncbi:unnamed protein product [Pylaiella littoralis]